MAANLENLAVATGLEYISSIPVPMKGNVKEFPSQFHSSHTLAKSYSKFSRAM